MKVQLMSPVYNEGKGVLRVYEELTKYFNDFDTLAFVYDTPHDTSVPFIEELSRKDPRVIAEHNQYGKGVVNALKWGFSKADEGPYIVFMADCSDKFEILPSMVDLWKGGATLVSPSRYMKGGRQHGGPKFKKFLSGSAGKVLSMLGFPTSDPTNNYKLYDGTWLRSQNIESTGGFEVALELTSKAYLQNKVITQLPTEWWDRTEGESNFNMKAWIPKYLRWYIPLLFFVPGKRLVSTFSK